MLVTLVECTCSRLTADCIGSRPSRLNASSRSTSNRANDSEKGRSVASTGPTSSCCARFTDVTSVMPGAASVQPCSIHCRRASAIGSMGIGLCGIGSSSTFTVAWPQLPTRKGTHR